MNDAGSISSSGFCSKRLTPLTTSTSIPALASTCPGLKSPEALEAAAPLAPRPSCLPGFAASPAAGLAGAACSPVRLGARAPGFFQGGVSAVQASMAHNNGIVTVSITSKT